MVDNKFKFVFRSTFVWIIVMLAATNIAWGLLRPLKNVPHTAQPPAFLTKAATAYKFQRFEELKTSPDLMVVGSSLPMCALFYGECPPYFDLAEGKRIQRAGLNLLQAYPFSGYLTHKMTEEFKTKKNVFNFSIAACMVSDARVILDRTIATGNIPKTVVFGVGLRDFVDNMNPPPGETPIYTALCDAQYLLKNFSETVVMPAFPHLFLSSICKMYGLRNECKLAFETNLCHMFQRQTNLEIAFKIASLNADLKNQTTPKPKSAPLVAKPAAADAAKQQAASTVPQQPVNQPASTAKESQTSTAQQPTTTAKNLPTSATTPEVTASEKVASVQSATKNASKDSNGKEQKISEPGTNQTADAGKKVTGKKVPIRNPFLATLDYMQRYGPANYRHLEKEMRDLTLFIDRCHENGIKIIVINMPVSAGHSAVSPPGLRERYLRDLEKTVSNADLYLNYENSELFEDADFFDTVHLNYNGSHKFVDDFVERYHKSLQK